MSAAEYEGPDQGPAASDPQAELALLAACLWSKTARQEARRHISGPDFYSPQHEAVWDAMSALDRAGKTIDAVTLGAHLVAAAPGQAHALSQLVVEVTTAHGLPDSAGDYAAIIRGWSTRRRLADAGRSLVQRATDTTHTPNTLAATAVRVLTGIRDHGAQEDVSALTLGELMDVPDDQPTWVIPGLLEAGDRLMLTGTEGAGKSALSRQIGVMAAAGVHPFTDAMMPPIKAVYVDCENKAAQVRRQVRPLVQWLGDHAPGGTDPLQRVSFDFTGRIDITRDRDLAAIHRLLDAWQPDLLVIGPLYRMTNKALQNDDDAAPFLVALDTIMERGVALIIEAHAGHGTEGQAGKGSRALRPRGSSSLLGWPEFGLGLRAQKGTPYADLEPWRGGREQRNWPTRMVRAAGNRWMETSPDGWGDPPPPPWTETPEPVHQGALL